MAVNLLVSKRESTTFIACNDIVNLRTEERLQFVDLTDLVTERVRRAGISHGLVNIQTHHTTTAIVVNEAEPLLLEDIKDLLERWAPRNGRYRHNDLEARFPPPPPEERQNGHSHARAIFLGASESLNIVDGKLLLGQWQRIFLVELDGARTRTVSIVVLGTKAD